MTEIADAAAVETAGEIPDEEEIERGDALADPESLLEERCIIANFSLAVVMYTNVYLLSQSSSRSPQRDRRGGSFDNSRRSPSGSR